MKNEKISRRPRRRYGRRGCRTGRGSELPAEKAPLCVAQSGALLRIEKRDQETTALVFSHSITAVCRAV